MSISFPSLRGSLFSGTVFKIKFEPKAEQDGLCTQTAEVRYTLDGNGRVILHGENIRLVDSPFRISSNDNLDEVNCRYSATFFHPTYPPEQATSSPSPQGEVSSEIRERSLALHTSSSTDIWSGSVTASASYNALFRPDITIDVAKLGASSSVSHPYAGWEFNVNFRPDRGSRGQECSGRTSQIYSIQNNGTVEPSGSKIGLLDKLVASDFVCSYDVSVQASFSSDSLSTNPDNPSTVMSAAASSFDVPYDAIFRPNLMFSIFLVEGSELDDFSGDTLYVDFGAVPNSNSVCTSSYTMIYDVGTDGSFVTTDIKPKLQDGTSDYDDRCRYSVSFEFEDDELIYSGEPLTLSGASPTETVSFSIVAP